MNNETVNRPRPRVTIREVLNRWFWLNYAITLLATCWIPLLTVTPTITVKKPEMTPIGNTSELSSLLAQEFDETTPALPGDNSTPEAITGPSSKIPLYTCYYRLAQGKFQSYALPVAIHLSLCFLVSFWIWRIVLGSSRKTA